MLTLSLQPTSIYINVINKKPIGGSFTPIHILIPLYRDKSFIVWDISSSQWQPGCQSAEMEDDGRWNEWNTIAG